MKVGKKVRGRVFSVLLAAIMALSMTPATAFGTDGDAVTSSVSQFADMPDNWSAKALQNAVANGLLSGTDGRIMPDQNLTRAQMAAVITRAFGAQVKGDLSGFTDVKAADWFSDSLAKAYQMGVIKGSDGLMKPNGAITRQEVFVILARAFKLQPADTMNKAFGDANKIAGWAKGEVYAFVNAGYIQGSNGNLNPTSLITRAEFAQIFDNLIKQYISTAGEYDKVAEGNIMINTPAVSLKNLKVTGDLIIGDGVGDGEITLDSVAVTGRLVVRGGGENSIIIKGSSSVSNVVVARVDGAVSVKVEGDAKVEVVYIDDGSDDVSVQGTFGNIEVAAPEIVVKAVNATIGKIDVAGEGTKVVVDAGSKVETVTVAKDASSSKVEVAGQVTAITIQAQNTQITGTGSVTKVEAQAGANGSKIETPNTQISVAPGAAGIKGAGDTEIKGGTTSNNNSDATGTTEPTAQPPSNTGGGSHTPPSVGVTNINVINATTVTFTCDAAPGKVLWDGAAVAGANISYNTATKVTTITVPTITKTANTLVVGASGYSDKTSAVNIKSSVGNLIIISGISGLSSAINSQADGQSWIIKAGTYDLPKNKTYNAQGVKEDWYLPIYKSVTISGEGKPTLTGSEYSKNGVWSSQNFITVFSDNVTIQGVKIKSKTETNKAIEVLGKDFKLKDTELLPSEDGTSGVIYFNPNNASDQVKDMGNIILEDVKITKGDVSYRDGAWSSGAMKGALLFKNVTIDNEDYGIPFNYGAIVGSENGGVTSKEMKVTCENLTIKLNNEKDMGYLNRFFAILQPGTAVKLAAGTYCVPAPLKVPAGVTLDAANVSYVYAQHEVDPAFEGTSADDGINGFKRYRTIQDAVAAAAAGELIALVSGTHELSEQYNLNKVVTLIGEGEDGATIKAKTGIKWGTLNTNKHLFEVACGAGPSPAVIENITFDSNAISYGLSTYSNAYLKLKNVTVKNSIGAGLTVNGSTVAAENLNTSGNGWGGVNVDPGDGVITPSVFTLTGSGTLSEFIQIWADPENTIGTTAIVNAGGYAMYKHIKKDSKIETVWLKDKTPVAAIAASPTEVYIYPTIKDAIDAAKKGTVKTVTLKEGTYNLTSTLTIDGPIIVTGEEGKRAVTKLIGAYTISGSTVTLSGGATLKGVTVTRDNSVWPEAENKNGTLVNFAQNLSADTTLENCIVTQGRNGVYLNSSYGGKHKAIIKNNYIHDVRTGIHFCQNCNNMEITGNTVTDCWTIGIVCYFSGKNECDLSTINLDNNTIKDNWLGQIFIKIGNPWDDAYSLVTGNLKLDNNDFGGAVTNKIETVTVAEDYSFIHAEPQYNDQQPVSFGGTAKRPSWTPPAVRIYGCPNAGITGSDILIQKYTDDPSGMVNVSSEYYFRCALADDSVTTINLTADFTTTSTAPNPALNLRVKNPVTINGGGHTITVGKAWGTSDDLKYAMDIFAGNVTIKNLTIDSNKLAYGVRVNNAVNVSLSDVTLKNSLSAGLTVNGSTVTANNLNTSDNASGGVNVDPDSKVTGPSVFTLTGSGTLSESMQIWSCGTNATDVKKVTVNAAGYEQRALKVGYCWVSSTVMTVDAPIAAGEIEPEITLQLAGDTFNSNALDKAMWTVDAGSTGLSIYSISADISANKVKILFKGTANAGTLTVKPDSSALTNGRVCEPLALTISPTGGYLVKPKEVMLQSLTGFSR